MTDTLYCSFCGKSQHEVRKLIAGPAVFICDECTELCTDIIREGHKLPLVESRGVLPTTDDIKSTLDGQLDGLDQVKRLLAVLLREHYRRLADAQDAPGASPALPSVLLAGSSTACREIARALQRFVDTPFVAVDATQLIELHDRREALEEIVLLLLDEANFHFQSAQRGFVFIEHLDQLGHLARSRHDHLSKLGRQTQEAIVNLMAGTVVDVSAAGNRSIDIDTRSIRVFCSGTFPGIVAADQDRERSADQDVEAGGDRLAVLPRLSDAQHQALVEFGLLPDLVDGLSVLLALDPVDPIDATAGVSGAESS